MTIPAATLRTLNDAAHAAWKQARKMNDPRAEDFAHVARATDALVDGAEVPARFATSA